MRKQKMNFKVVDPMKAIGLDLTDSKIYFPKNINHAFIKEKLNNVVKVFTMGCMDNKCELPLGMKVKADEILDWDLDDPTKDETDVVEVRDNIIGNVLELINVLRKS